MPGEEPAASYTSYIGIDIGGTSTRIALFKDLSTSSFQVLGRFPTHAAYEQQLAAIASILTSNDSLHIAGLGVSVGGRMARDGRAVLVAPNLPEYVGRAFAADLEQLCHCPVRMAHDTVCGLLGEVRLGILRGSERAAYLTLSTGTGAALYLQKGSHALAVSIEIGHQILDGNERVCLCGQTGCLETYTGGRQLEQRLGHPLSAVADDEVWSQLRTKLALGLINLTQLARVEVIAVSGAIILNNPSLFTAVQQEIDARLCGSSLELRRAQLGENAPLVGAVQLLVTPDETILH